MSAITGKFEHDDQKDTRVDHSQYPSNPLATAATNGLVPTTGNTVHTCRCSMFRHPHDPAEHDPDPDYGFNGWREHVKLIARDTQHGHTICKLNRVIREKRRQIKGRDRGLMYWRRWAEARFFDGERRGGTDAQVRDRIDALLGAGGGNQLPSGLRGDPGAPRTVNGEARDKESDVR